MRLRRRGNENANAAGAGTIANVATSSKDEVCADDGPAARRALRNVTNETNRGRQRNKESDRNGRKRPRDSKTNRAEEDDSSRRRVAAKVTATKSSGRDAKHAVGTRVSKLFLDEESGEVRPFSGTVVGFDPAEMFYRVRYEDGDEEELDEEELSAVVVVVRAPRESRDANENEKSKRRRIATKANVISECKINYAVGTAVSRAFLDEDSNEERPFSGEVVGFDANERLYRVRYEDGDEEELDEEELRQIVVPAIGARGKAIDSSSAGRKQTATAPAASADRRAGADDIDEPDSDDPLAVTPYVRDIYDHFRATEALAPVTVGLKDRQERIHIRQRGVLVDWLVEWHSRWRLEPQTLYLATSVIDRYLAGTVVGPPPFQLDSSSPELRLLGATALLIASKYEEIYPPEMCDLVEDACDGTCTAREIIEYEEIILRRLEYRITVPTAHNFLVRYLKAGHANERMARLSNYVLDGTLVSFDLLRYLPSQLAAAAVLVARVTAGRSGWTPTLATHAGYSEEEVRTVARAVSAERSKARSEWRAVDEKYADGRHGGVSDERLASDF